MSPGSGSSGSSARASQSGTKRRLAVLGANGKMGRAVVRLAEEAGLEITLAIGAGDVGRDVGELAGIGTVGVALTSDLGALKAAPADILVDFSAPAVLAAAAPLCVEGGIAIVSGTTGLDDTAKNALDAASSKVGVLWEPNMSIGVHVLSRLVEEAALALGPGYDIEIVEAHHRAKVDAPSGTAIRLAEVARRGRARSSGTEPRFVHGREGRPGARPKDEIGVLAMRGGDVIGDHTVFFLGDGERLELSHRASSRDLFARGALRAAAWLAGRPSGRYQLRDVLEG